MQQSATSTPASPDDGFYFNSGRIRNREGQGAWAAMFDWYSLDLSGPQDPQPDQAE